jgi:membrane associated rhomboid family serine protease
MSPGGRQGVLLVKRLMNSPAVLSIIALQVVVYVAQLVKPGVSHRLSLPVGTEGLGNRPWSPLTVMFVHENLAHLAVMVLMLAAFGPLLEQCSRALDVIVVYLVAGLAGSLAVLTAFAVFEPEGTLVGASAAVLGVSAAFLAMHPSSRVFGGKATQWLAVLVAINIVFLLSLPLGSVAHLVGIAVGLAYGRWLRARVRPYVEQPT